MALQFGVYMSCILTKTIGVNVMVGEVSCEQE